MSFTLGVLWIRHPDHGPTIPEPVWAWLAKLYGPTNGEEMADLEALVVYGTCLVAVSLLTWGVLRLKRKN